MHTHKYTHMPCMDTPASHTSHPMGHLTSHPSQHPSSIFPHAHMPRQHPHPCHTSHSDHAMLRTHTSCLCPHLCCASPAPQVMVWGHRHAWSSQGPPLVISWYTCKMWGAWLLMAVGHLGQCVYAKEMTDDRAEWIKHKDWLESWWCQWLEKQCNEDLA